MITLSGRTAAAVATGLTSLTALVTAGAMTFAPIASAGDRSDLESAMSPSGSMQEVDAAEVEQLHAEATEASAQSTEAAGFLGNSATTFISVEPCRIIDTRKSTAGKFVAGTKRNFTVAGDTGFSAQGGAAAGCAIPENAVAVSAALKSVSASTNGYLRVWGYGEAEPTATALTFSKGVDIGDATIVTLGAPGLSYGISAKPYLSSMHLIVDVTGYYVLNDHGLVTADGGLDSGGATLWAIDKPATGVYELTVDHDIWYCSYSVTPFDANLIASTSYSQDWINAFDVQLRQPDGTPVDGDFYYSVTC